MATLDPTFQHTNAKLQQRRRRQIKEGNFFYFLGIRLAMAVEPHRGPNDVYW